MRLLTLATRRSPSSKVSILETCKECNRQCSQPLTDVAVEALRIHAGGMVIALYLPIFEVINKRRHRLSRTLRPIRRIFSEGKARPGWGGPSFDPTVPRRIRGYITQ